MNSYITELASMIPMCHTMPRKLDKLSVLRMAVQHMKTIRSTVNSYTEGHYKPSFLSDQDLKTLITHVSLHIRSSKMTICSPKIFKRDDFCPAVTENSLVLIVISCNIPIRFSISFSTLTKKKFTGSHNIFL